MTVLGLVFLLFGVAVIVVSAGVDLCVGRLSRFRPFTDRRRLHRVFARGPRDRAILSCGAANRPSTRSVAVGARPVGIVAGLAIVKSGLRLAELVGGAAALFLTENQPSVFDLEKHGTKILAAIPRYPSTMHWSQVLLLAE